MRLNSAIVTASHIPLVDVTRGDLVESVHYGSFVATAPNGDVLYSGGEPGSPVYPRSSLKPLQAAAMVAAGLELPDDLLALSAASHSGAADHIAGVERILGMHGLDASALRNTPDVPYGSAERRAWVAADRGPTRRAQACSGKHAAMLATCVINGWPVHSYLEVDHPLQVAIAESLEAATGERASATAVDGCGTPVFAYSLTAVARAYGRLASAPTGTPEGSVAHAMRAHPYMVGGAGRDVTDLMTAVPGLIAKDGAESVQLVGLADGSAVAVKISDGGDRARMPITAAILARLGVSAPALEPFRTSPVLGGGQPVGELRACENLFMTENPAVA